MISHLRQQGISDWHIHALTRDEASLSQLHIHSDHLILRYDLINLGERSAVVGFILSPGWSLSVHIPRLIPCTFSLPEALFTLLAFIVFGVWSGVAGISRSHYKIARFQKDIDSGV